MIADLVVAALAMGALAAVAAAALEPLLRAARLPRRVPWIAALLATPVLALLVTRESQRPPSAAVPIPSVSDAAGDATLDLAPVWTERALSAARAGADALGATVSDALGIARAVIPARAEPWIAVGWALVSLAALTAFAVTYVRMRARVRALPTHTIEGERVRLSMDAGPVVVGVARPDVVLPAWLLARPDDEQRLALAHEREHVRARDPLVLALGCALAGLLPWHPLAWWMLARLRRAVELDCDQRVLARGARPRAYGTLLIDVAGRGTTSSLVAAALAPARTHLEERILAMTASRSRRAILRALVPALLAPVALVAACEAKLPTNAEVENMDAAGAERHMAQLRGTMTLDSVQYFLNDRLSTAAEVHAIPAAKIASVTIRKEGRPALMVITRDHESAVARVEGSAPYVATLAPSRKLPGSPSDSGALHVVVEDVPARQAFEGLIIIDGRRSDEATMRRLAPTAIASIDVIKGDRARAMFDDPAAANGVLRIVTKSAASESRP